MANHKKMVQTSIKKNYIYNTIYQVLSLITPLITAPYISRVLGSNGVGIYSYTNSIVTYFTLFAALGTASYGQREIAMHRDDPETSSKLFWEIEILSLTTTAVSLIVWIAWIFISTQYTAIYSVLTLSVLAVAFHSLLARPVAFSAERRWYAQAFAANPDTAVAPPVLAVLSAAVPARFAGKAVPLPVVACAAVEPAAACWPIAVAVPDAGAATFADAVQAFVRSTVLR